MGSYAKAEALAEQRHRGQVDKAGKDYFRGHLKEVAHLVALMGGDVEAQIVALLHDILEDTETTEAELRAKFGDAVADAVVAVTREPGEIYVEFIDRVVATGGPAAIVKKADILSHLLDTSAIPDSLVKRYRKALKRFT